jgi:hypothetical protein
MLFKSNYMITIFPWNISYRLPDYSQTQQGPVIAYYLKRLWQQAFDDTSYKPIDRANDI